MSSCSHSAPASPYAATQLASTDGTQVCVNKTNGLMRATSTCRESESSITIGGGNDVVVTQNGTVTVGVGENASKALPLTGITVTGRCELLPAAPPYPFDQVIARIRLDAASGETMDILPAKVIGGSSWVDPQLLAGAGVFNGQTITGGNFRSYVVSSRGATATITVSAIATTTPQTCSFLWQATEAPN